MDHFYTAVEERERSELHGKPVIVGANPKDGKGRGVVQTANYEARKFGVRSGMPISKAWKLCPLGVFLPPNFELYIRVSNEIMNILRIHADKFEQWGIDEAFLDVSSKADNFDKAEELARHLKTEIHAEEKLTCSIGVGPNKLIAKMASEAQKPNGLTVVKPDDMQRFLEPLPVRKLLWVGKKTEQKLAGLGVKTIGELARFDPSVLTDMFGVVGVQLYLMAHGTDDGEVKERNEVKSIGRETTFETDTTDIEEINEALDQLAEQVITDVLDQKVYFKTVTVKVRYENFETHTHSKSLARMTNSPKDFKKAARELLGDYLRPDTKIRLIGVRASNFTSAEKQQVLF